MNGQSLGLKRRLKMNNRVFKVLAFLVALTLALGVGTIAGGAIMYALTRSGGGMSVVAAQGADPGYGIVIAAVDDDGPAAEAGVVRGDILLEIDTEVLESFADLARYLDDLEPGVEVELQVLHGDEQRTLTATLGDHDGRAYLGLTPCGIFQGAVSWRVDGPGALIVEVEPDSPADEVGLQEGDVIVAVDGQDLDVENSLADLIAEYEPGDTVTLTVERAGEESRELDVELGEHPEEEGVAFLGVRYMSFPHVGVFSGDEFRNIRPHLEFEDIPLDDFRLVLPYGDYSDIEQGAIVRRVYEDSPASAAGLERGDVITAIDGEPVESPESLSNAIAEREPGDEITLTVFRLGDEEEREIKVALAEHPDEEDKAYLGVLLGGFFHIGRYREGEELPDFEFRFPQFFYDEGEWRFDELPFDFDFDFDFDFVPDGESI
jgi:S1-C subfamily serine protease